MYFITLDRFTHCSLNHVWYLYYQGMKRRRTCLDDALSNETEGFERDVRSTNDSRPSPNHDAKAKRATPSFGSTILSWLSWLTTKKLSQGNRRRLIATMTMSRRWELRWNNWWWHALQPTPVSVRSARKNSHGWRITLPRCATPSTPLMNLQTSVSFSNMRSNIVTLRQSWERSQATSSPWIWMTLMSSIIHSRGWRMKCLAVAWRLRNYSPQKPLCLPPAYLPLAHLTQQRVAKWSCPDLMFLSLTVKKSTGILSGNLSISPSIVEQISPTQRNWCIWSSHSRTTKGVIEGLSKSGEHYEEAIKSLKVRYDRPRLIHQTHVRMILEATSLKEGTGKELRRLHDMVQQHLRALRAMDYEPSGTFITSVLELKLNTNTMFEWQKFSQYSPKVLHFWDLLEFVNIQAQTSLATTKKGADVDHRLKTSAKQITSFAASASANSESTCILCKTEKHPLFACHQFKAMSHDEKISTLKSQDLCFVTRTFR